MTSFRLPSEAFPLERLRVPRGGDMVQPLAWGGYEYDPAHRLTATKDNPGNRIEYTLDNAGNRTAESVKGIAHAGNCG